MDFKFDELPTVQPCGKPTNRGTPCTRNAEMFVPGCGHHATEEEISLGRKLLRAWQGGFRAGQRKNTDRLMETIRDLKDEIKVLKSVGFQELRIEDQGTQIVEVNNFAYRWSGKPPLEVGEDVILPPTPHSRRLGYPGNWPGRVDRVGTGWGGKIVYEIVSRKGDPR